MATCDSYIDAAILVQLDAKLLVIAYLKETFLLNDVLPKKKILKPCANGSNIVGSYMLRPFADPVACCCLLLHKVWNRSNFWPTTLNISFVPWSPKSSATILDPFAQLLEHWWVNATGRQKEEDGKIFVCDKRDRAITYAFCRDRHLTLMFSGRLQKDLFKARWSLAESFFKQNYRHVCHTRFAFFFPLLPRCVLLGRRTLITHGSPLPA